jgi:hypothetical protein
LINFGSVIKRPRKHKYIPRSKRARGKTTKFNNFHDMVKRQWQDGFRAKAIQMLDKDWKTKPSVKTGLMLCKYHSELKDYHSVLRLYDIMLEMDDCPMSISENYNKIKKQAKAKTTPVTKNISKHTSSTPRRLITTVTKMPNGTISVSIGPPPGFWDKNKEPTDKGLSIRVVNGKKHTRYVPLTRINKEADLKKYFFIDRDKVGEEWAPGAPCQTINLFQVFPGKTIFKGLKNPRVDKYGVALNAYLRSFPHQYELKKFFDYRNLYSRYYTPPRFNDYIPHWDDPSGFYYTRPPDKQIRRIQTIYKPTVIVLQKGWNSVNPFSGNLDSNLIYTRLGYFFEMFESDKIKAFFEFKNNPELPMPRFTFFNPRDNKAYVSQIKTAKDMIRYMAYKALRKYYENKKSKYHKFTGRDYKLYQLLAIDYMAKRNDSRAKEFYRKIMSLPIPKTSKEYHKMRSSITLLTFLAYKKKRKAIRALSYFLDSGDYSIKSQCNSDHLYVLAKIGLVSLTAKMAKHGNVNSNNLRWFPKPFIDKFLLAYGNTYLMNGTKNLKVAKTYLLTPVAYNADKVINQLFGKPPIEVYQDWRAEHFKQLKELATRKKEVEAK